MPVDPLFVSNMASLKASLRLTGATQPDTLATLDRIVQEVRVGFYESLGANLVDLIRSYPLVDNPTTTEELARVKASNTEVCWAKMRLLEELPVIFMDASGNVDQMWNEEGITREASSREVSRLIASLRDKVRDALSDLSGNGGAGSAEVFVIQPDTTPPRPGQSLFPGRILT